MAMKKSRFGINAIALKVLCVFGGFLFWIGSLAAAPNYIVMIGDDMGVETLNCYGVGTSTAHTPNLDRLCDQGIRFDNFWSQPVCSPTRATLLTGQYGFKNGVGSPASWSIASAASNRPTSPGLADDAYTLMHALGSADYQTAAVGKWHLASGSNGGLQHPQNAGFDHYAGNLEGGRVESFYQWLKVVDGSDPVDTSGYVTTDTVDDALAWYSKVDQAQPWLLWVAFNAPHLPFHMPPVELLSSAARDLDPDKVAEDEHAYFNAMLEAMDTEIGRLLEGVGEEALADTYIIFMGDNGTPDETARAPFEPFRAKATLYQGGINVPLMIAGPDIDEGKVSASLANSVDLFATILDLSDISLPEAAPSDAAMHSVSLEPIIFGDSSAEVRDFAYADMFGRLRGAQVNYRTLRNQTHKLLQNLMTGEDALYNLDEDPYENNNLLPATSEADQQMYQTLLDELTALNAN